LASLAALHGNGDLPSALARLGPKGEWKPVPELIENTPVGQRNSGHNDNGPGAAQTLSTNSKLDVLRVPIILIGLSIFFFAGYKVFTHPDANADRAHRTVRKDAPPGHQPPQSRNISPAIGSSHPSDPIFDYVWRGTTVATASKCQVYVMAEFPPPLHLDDHICFGRWRVLADILLSQCQSTPTGAE